MEGLFAFPGFVRPGSLMKYYKWCFLYVFFREFIICFLTDTYFKIYWAFCKRTKNIMQICVFLEIKLYMKSKQDAPCLII